MEKPGNELLLIVATHVKLNGNNVAGVTLLSKVANKNMNITLIRMSLNKNKSNTSKFNFGYTL